MSLKTPKDDLVQDVAVAAGCPECKVELVAILKIEGEWRCNNCDHIPEDGFEVPR